MPHDNDHSPDHQFQVIEGGVSDESAETAVLRLAGLPEIEYERCRKEEAKRLGIRASVPPGPRP
jgi:hypothetical protein